MGRFSGLLICSDFDGTLYGKQGITDATREAVRYFKEHGGRITLATGRFPHIVEEKGLEAFFNAPIVAMNGTILYDCENQKILHEVFLERDIEEATVRYCRECTSASSIYFSMQRNWESVKIAVRDVEQIRSLLREKLYKIAIKVDRERSDEAKAMAVAQFGEGYTITRSCDHLVEIQESKSDKGKTARHLARMLGADQLICVGDYENDIPMILEADIGVAMGNAIESVKQIADRVTASVDEDGIAKLIYEL